MKKKALVFLFFLGLILRLIFSVQIYSGDVNNHIGWAKDALEKGFPGIYERSFEKYGVMTPTYPPIPLFFFTFFYWLFTLVYNFAWKFNSLIGIFPSKIIWFLEDQDTLPAFLKIPGILADLGIAYLVYLFGKKILGKKAGGWPIFLACLVLFNPAFFYNSALWGQIEAVPLFFILASFYCLIFNNHRLSLGFLSLAVLTKQTSIIFLPLYALIYFQKYGFKRSIKGALVFLAIFVLFFLPFFKEGNWLTFPFITYWHKIQTGSGSNYVTDHAFNFWALISGLGKIPDWHPFWLKISYSTWGYLIFGISQGVIFLRLLKKNPRLTDYFFAAALIPFSAFLFLTRMHERYFEPVLPFLLLLALKNKGYFFFFFFLSLFYLINLYHNWWAPDSLILRRFLTNIPVINFLIVLIIGVFIFLNVKYSKGEFEK